LRLQGRKQLAARPAPCATHPAAVVAKSRAVLSSLLIMARTVALNTIEAYAPVRKIVDFQAEISDI